MNTVGKRLQQARLKRQLSVEEAARTTKLRTERILDLENDTYANFPNLAYAKGFLIIYAKYLGVDVSDFTQSFEISSPVGRNDYQYLSNAPQALPAVRRREGGPPAKSMLIAGGVLGIMLAVGFFITYLVVSAQRLGMIQQPASRAKVPEAVASATPAPPQMATRAALPAPSPVVKPAPAQTPPPPPAALATPGMTTQAAPSPSVEIRRAVIADPIPAASAPDATVATRRE